MIKMKDMILQLNKVSDFNLINTLVNLIKQFIKANFKHSRIIYVNYEEVKIDTKKYTGTWLIFLFKSSTALASNIKKIINTLLPLDLIKIMFDNLKNDIIYTYNNTTKRTTKFLLVKKLILEFVKDVINKAND